MKGMELIGKCGIYCGVCTIYRAERDSPNYRQELADTLGKPVEQITCQGCGALTSKCWGFKCEILKCLQDREFEFCDECPNYEKRMCDIYEDLVDKFRSAGMDLRDNLDLIRHDRLDLLQKSTERVFTCKSCGKLRAARAEKCHHCGEPTGFKA